MSQKYYSRPLPLYIKKYFTNPSVRTINLGKTVYDRKKAGETLEDIRKDLKCSRMQVSRLYNWYRLIMKKEDIK